MSPTTRSSADNKMKPAPTASKTEGQVTLTQMLKALDKDVAVGIERKLKKLSKKKAIKKPLDKNKADQIERQTAYSTTSKEISRWEPIVDQNRRARQLKFPLDQEPDILPTTAESVSQLKPSNELEKEVHNVITTSDSALHDHKELSKAEEKYLKAISVEEAQDRHRELQRMRVLLSSYAAKMRRQKAIKSKSYHRLLKQERLKRHMKKVESSKDLLVEEIERLQRLRAQERASLKHKNTGKWAKHAKFRAKYDDNARKAMLEQIGMAEKFLEKPASSDSESEDEENVVSDDSEVSSNEGENETKLSKKAATAKTCDRLIVSNEIINLRSLRWQTRSANVDSVAEKDEKDEDGEEEEDDDDEEDEQRKLMSEAFADDDVVGEFQRAKDQLADEEQPKDKDLFLPGWGDWAGPGIKINKRKRKKYIVKAKKIPRRDDNLGNVIISEQANSKVNNELKIKKLPRGIKSEEQHRKMLSKPIVSTFVSQAVHRKATQPRIQTKMGARIEPLNMKMLKGASKAKWT